MLADAMLAEELGFDSLWVAENHFSVDRQCSSPFVIAGVLAGATRRIRIGVFSILTFAHPLRLAEDAATLDLMSGGRLMLCFGTGYRAGGVRRFRDRHGWQGGALPRVPGRGAKGLGGAIRASWQTLSHSRQRSRTRQPKRRRRRPATTAANAIPLWMAAFGNVSVKRAARLGYPLLPAALESIPELQAKYQLYHATWRAGERTAPPVAMPLMRVVYVAPQAHTAHQEAEAGLMHDIRPLSALGIADQCRERLCHLGQGPFYHRRPAQVIAGDPALSRALRHHLPDLPHGYTCRSA